MRAPDSYRNYLTYKAIAFSFGLLFPVFGFSQVAGDYRSNTIAGNWSALASWQRYNGAAWAVPTAGEGYPGQNAVPGTVTIQSFNFITLDVSPANNIGSLSLAGGVVATLLLSGNQNLSVNGNLSMGSTSIFTFSGTGNLSIGGTTTLTSAFFTDNNNTGISTFTGLVTLSGASIWTSTAVTTTGNLIFQGGIANSGTSFSAGGATFNTNNQNISGSTSVSFANTVTVTTIRLGNLLVNPLSITISGDLTGTGEYRHTAVDALLYIAGNATVTLLTATFSPNTVIYNGSGAQSLKGTTYHHLTINKSAGTATPGAAFTCNGNLTINNAGTLASGGALTHAVTGTTSISAGVLSTDNLAGVFNLQDLSMTGGSIVGTAIGTVSVATTFTIPSGSVTINTTTFTILGATSITGAITFNINNTGANTFKGTVTMNPGSSWTSTALTTSANLVFRGGIVSNGTSFNAGSGRFDTSTPQTVSGTTSLDFTNRFTVIAGVVLTNNLVSPDAINVGIDLTGGGTLIQGTNALLTIGGDALITTLTATANPNTVIYNGAIAQSIKATIYHHLTITNTNTKTLSGITDINGTLSIQGTVVFSAGGFNITVGGDWNNSSTNADPFTRGTGTVTFDGAAAQTITNTGDAQGTEFYNLTLANAFGTSPQITLAGNVIADNTFTMTSGNVNLNANTFTIGTAAGAPGSLSYTAGWIYGGVLDRWYNTVTIADGGAAGLYPIGTSVYYRPLYISFPAAAPTAGGTISTSYADVSTVTDVVVPDGASTIVVRHNSYWSLLTGNGLTVPASATELRAEVNGIAVIGDVNDLRLMLVGSVIGTAGTNGGTPAIPIIRRVAIAGYGPGAAAADIYLGSVDKGSSPLPVDFLLFNATPNKNVVDVTWTTAAEFNSDYFIVQHSPDGTSFENVAQVKASGNSSIVKNYSAVDADPYSGTSYYRLKQVDNDGKFTYSDVVAVNFGDHPLISIYPNPSNGPFSVEIEGSTGKQVLLVVRDIQGREFYSMVILLTNNKEVIEVDADGKLAQGIYTVVATSDNSTLEKKVLITK